MALSMLAIAGEEAWSFASNLLKLGDGSFIAVSLDKPSYNAGETMTGKVVAQIMSPVVCDEVALKVRLASSSNDTVRQRTARCLSRHTTMWPSNAPVL